MSRIAQQNAFFLSCYLIFLFLYCFNHCRKDSRSHISLMNEDEDAQVENIPPSTVVIEYMKHRGLRAL